jgi:hypothetical protein
LETTATSPDPGTPFGQLAGSLQRPADPLGVVGRGPVVVLGEVVGVVVVVGG